MPPTQPAPAGVSGVPQLLRAKVDGVPFPDYGTKFDWRPTGARHDGPGDRNATTVYYEGGIVSGDALDPPR
jgi:hypothetical protein